MIGALVAILKVIGIILLILLVIILVLLCLVLFVPIRYDVAASFEDKKLWAKVQVTWLLRFVRVVVEFIDGGLSGSLKILAFTIKRIGKTPERPSGTAGRADGQAGVQTGQAGVQTGQADGQAGVQTGQADVQTGQVEAVNTADGQTGTDDPAGNIVSQDDNEDKESGTQIEITVEQDHVDVNINLPEKDHQPAGHVTESVDSASAAGSSRDVKDNDVTDTDSGGDAGTAHAPHPDVYSDDSRSSIGRILDKVTDVIDFIRDPANEALIAQIIDTVKKVLLQLKPTVLEIDAIIGLEDPFDTAEVLAISYMLYPLYQGCIRVIGDFEEERLEGKIHAAGAVHLYVIVFAGIKLWLNKDFRKMLQRFL